MISGILSLSGNKYLCTLPTPITKTRRIQVVAEIADLTAQQTI